MAPTDQTLSSPPVSIVLGSSSIYRKQLLSRFGLDFSVDPPNIDETRHDNELPADYVHRLAIEKATAVSRKHADSIIIGSDQCAEVSGEILGKPGTTEKAVEQLMKLSGQSVFFHTGLCVIHTGLQQSLNRTIPFEVRFRAFDRSEAQRYVALERPLDCAGSFKSEGLGICLFEKMSGDDPTALMGLPLITLHQMLRQLGLVIP